MQEKIVTLEDLSEATGLCVSSLRVYVCNYRFNKFVTYKKINNRARRCYILNKDFVTVMSDFLMNYRRYRKLNVVKNLREYFKKEVLLKDD